MGLDGIDVFVAVVDAKSFSRAAERLDMPTTTVSARIARLEERLGVTLLRRTTRKLSLTEAGERYYVHCTLALDAMSEAERALAREAAEPRGTLRITAPADLSHSLLPPIIDAFLEACPHVKLDLLISNAVRDLIGERIDLALRAGEVQGNGLVIRKFLTGMMTLWGAPDYLSQHAPITAPRNLSAHRLLSLKAGRQAVPMLWRGKAEPDLFRDSRVELDDLQTCRSFVEAGLGLGLLPHFDPPGSVDYGPLKPVLPGLHSAPFTAYFVYPQQRFVPPTVRQFIDTAHEVVQQKTRSVRPS
ncbi:MAG: LysR family transcriptional regulator [Paracoccaceae bacterium]